MGWITNNKTSMALFAAAICVALGLAILQGCSLDQLIPVSVPRVVQRQLQIPATIPIAEAEGVLEQLDGDYKRSREQMVANYNDAMWLKDLASAGINTGVTVGEGALAGLPGGALGIAVLTALGGLFVSKPGERKALKEQAKTDIQAAVTKEAAKWLEKQNSYNKGVTVGKNGGA